MPELRRSPYTYKSDLHSDYTSCLQCCGRSDASVCGVLRCDLVRCESVQCGVLRCELVRSLQCSAMRCGAVHVVWPGAVCPVHAVQCYYIQYERLQV